MVSSDTGEDNLHCLQQNTSSPCKTLSYVLNNSPSLNNSEVVLFGDHSLNQTLSISNVEGIIIRGGGEKASVIKCFEPGSGLLITCALRMKILNVVFDSCGTIQYSTMIRNSQSVKHHSAVYVINSTDIELIETSFYRSTGRALSLYDVNGQVQVSNSTFVDNMIPSDSESDLFGGGSIYIEFTYCSPGHGRCNPESNTHNKNSRYLISNCVLEGNRAFNKEVSEERHTIQFKLFEGRYDNVMGEGGGIFIKFRGLSFNNSVTVENCVFQRNSAVWGGGMSALFLDMASNSSLLIKGKDALLERTMLH